MGGLVDGWIGGHGVVESVSAAVEPLLLFVISKHPGRRPGSMTVVTSSVFL